MNELEYRFLFLLLYWSYCIFMRKYIKLQLFIYSIARNEQRIKYQWYIYVYTFMNLIHFNAKRNSHENLLLTKFQFA